MIEPVERLLYLRPGGIEPEHQQVPVPGLGPQTDPVRGARDLSQQSGIVSRPGLLHPLQQLIQRVVLLRRGHVSPAFLDVAQPDQGVPELVENGTVMWIGDRRRAEVLDRGPQVAPAQVQAGAQSGPGTGWRSASSPVSRSTSPASPRPSAIRARMARTSGSEEGRGLSTAFNIIDPPEPAKGLGQRQARESGRRDPPSTKPSMIGAVSLGSHDAARLLLQSNIWLKSSGVRRERAANCSDNFAAAASACSRARSNPDGSTGSSGSSCTARRKAASALRAPPIPQLDLCLPGPCPGRQRRSIADASQMLQRLGVAPAGRGELSEHRAHVHRSTDEAASSRSIAAWRDRVSRPSNRSWAESQSRSGSGFDRCQGEDSAIASTTTVPGYPG